MYLSLCYVVIDAPRGHLRYNAGHPHAFVLRADGTAERLGATDPPLGLGEQAPHVATVAWNGSDDLLVLFTDGISDALDERGRRSGNSACSTSSGPVAATLPCESSTASSRSSRGTWAA